MNIQSFFKILFLLESQCLGVKNFLFLKIFSFLRASTHLIEHTPLLYLDEYLCSRSDQYLHFKALEMQVKNFTSKNFFLLILTLEIQIIAKNTLCCYAHKNSALQRQKTFLSKKQSQRHWLSIKKRIFEKDLVFVKKIEIS